MTAESGLRKRRVSFFVQVPRETIRDSSISFRARGLLAYLLDMPDGWDVKSEVLAEAGKEGREAVRTALHELGGRGYYRIERRRLASGRFSMGTAISEEPVAEWAAEYEEFAGKPVPCQQQRDGSFLVVHKDGTLTSDGFDVEAPVDGTTRTADDDEGTLLTGNGFPGPGSPGSGSPASGKLDAIREREKGDREGTTSDASLRSPSAPLDEVVIPETPPAKRTRTKAKPKSAEDDADPRMVEAGEIVKAFQTWVEDQQRAPIPATQKARAFMALRKQYVYPALESGATRAQIAHALAACKQPWPSQGAFQDELVRARGGIPLGGRQYANGQRGAFIDPTGDTADSWAAITVGGSK